MGSNYTILAVAVIALVVSVAGIGLLLSTNSALSALNDNIASINANLNAEIVKINSAITALTVSFNQTQDELNAIKASYYPLIVKDADDRIVTFNSAPQRIVSMAPSITETLFALNLSSSIVAVDTYSDYPPLLMQLENSSAITTVGGLWNPDIEKIASLKPDVVFLDQGLQERFVSTLTNLGLNVVVLKSRHVSDVEDNLLLVGKITSKVTEAHSIVNNIENAINYVSGKVRNAAPVSVMEIAGPPQNGLWSAGNSTFFNDVIQIAGGINIFNDKTGWYNPNGEDVISRNPKFIILDTMDLTGYSIQQVRDWFNAQPGFDKVHAIANDNFYIIHGQAANAVERAGPRIADMIKIYAYILHPEIFGADIPRDLADEYQNYIG